MTGEESLSEKVSIRENIAAGIAPNFGPQGFIKSPTVSLVQNGFAEAPSRPAPLRNMVVTITARTVPSHPML